MAICFHLCRRSDRVSLIPAGEAESAVFYQRLFYGVTEVEPYLWLADKERFVRNEAMPAGIADYSIHKVTRAFGSINRWLAAAPYIAGDAFTLADVLYFHLVTWAAMYGVSLAPATAKYVEALASRPAFPPGMAMAGPPPLAG
jgi:glutathione S-transferase